MTLLETLVWIERALVPDLAAGDRGSESTRCSMVKVPPNPLHSPKRGSMKHVVVEQVVVDCCIREEHCKLPEIETIDWEPTHLSFSTPTFVLRVVVAVNSNYLTTFEPKLKLRHCLVSVKEG